MKVIIIGSGWYGSHISKKLCDDHEICIIEKNNRIFCGSSYYNQNRLHLGFHYPRNFDTRNSCKNYFDNFYNEYNFLVDNIDNNYYVISKESLLDFQTYKNIYDFEKHNYYLVDNEKLTNIDGNIFCVEEKFINADKAREYFEHNLKHKNIEIKLQETFIKYTKKNNEKIQVYTDKSIYDCDMLIDCTYNHSNLSSKNYNYEITISLIYKKIVNCEFDSLTIMDGKFCSLYKRDINKQLYTLTDVEHTPIKSSKELNEIKEYKLSDEIINIKKIKMEEKIKKYFNDFEKHFTYVDYFISYKTKLVSNSDFRDLIFEEVEKNVITVNCGKIYGIFKFEDLIIDYISNQT